MTPAEVVSQMLDAFYSNGVAGARAFYDPQITWISRFPRERVLRGPDEVSHGLDELEHAGKTVVPITREAVDRGPVRRRPRRGQIREAGSVRQTQVWWVISVRNDKVLSGEDCLSREQLEAAVARCSEDA